LCSPIQGGNMTPANANERMYISDLDAMPCYMSNIQRIRAPVQYAREPLTIATRSSREPTSKRLGRENAGR
jgi:hypothetical protein